MQGIGADDSERVVFSEFQGGGTRASTFLIRQGRWKFVFHCAAPHQLFDLEADPEELVNVAAKQAGVVRRMERELRRICSPERENERAEEYARRQLVALGRAPK